jgi:hypothetical protein
MSAFEHNPDYGLVPFGYAVLNAHSEVGKARSKIVEEWLFFDSASLLTQLAAK